MTGPSEFPATVKPAAISRAGLWNPRRVSLLTALERLDATSAGLYRRAVDGLAELPWSVDGLVLVSTCVRELVNRLPEVLGEVKVAGFKSERGSIQALERALTQAGLDEPVGGQPSDGRHSPRPEQGTELLGVNSEHVQQWVPVPRSVLDAAQDVTAASREGSARSYDLRSALVRGADVGGGSDSIVRLLSGAISAFEARRHPRGDVSGWADGGAEVYVRRWEVIEQVLEGRIGRFFDVVTDLQKLLERANKITGREWSVPEDDLVTQAMVRLADLQHRRVFFDGLQNPEWVTVLERRRVFDDPPRHLVDDTGTLPYLPWPQGDYLHRMATHDPQGVASILARVVNSESSWNVRELVVRVAAEVPADASLPLLGHVATVVDDPRVGEYCGMEVVQVIESLAAGGHRKPAMKLAHLLLRPRAAEDTTRRRVRNVGAGIDPHSYDEALRRVVEAFDGDLDVFSATVWWLDLHQRFSGTFTPDHNYDYSRMRHPSLESSSRHSLRDEIGEPLIDTVRDSAIRLIDTLGPDPVLIRLRRPQAPILRRIELYALARTISSHPDVPAVAVGYLIDPRQADAVAGGREYDQLVKNILPTVAPDTFTAWENIVLAGPNLDEDARVRITSFNGGDPDVAIARYIERRQLDQLHSVGQDVLRGRSLAHYQELIDKHGDPDARVTTPEADEQLSADQLEGLTAAQVLDLVAQRVETGDLKASDRADNLGTVFGSAVTGRVAEFSALADQVLRMEPRVVQRYLLALTQHLQGVREAESQEGSDEESAADFREGQSASIPTSQIDWDALLSALLAADSWHETPDESYGGWRWVRNEICSLLEDAAESNLPHHLLPTAVEVISIMIDDGDPTPSTEERFGGSNMDPLTHSLNTVRPSAVRALIRLTRADVTHRAQRTILAAETDVVRDHTRRMLSRLLRPQRDHSLTIAAVLGEQLGWLIGNEAEWLAEHSPQLLSSDAFGDVVISTALVRHNPHPMLIQFLAPAIAGLLERVAAGGEFTPEMRYDRTPLQLVGDHLVTLYTWNQIELDDDLLRRYFALAPVVDRAAVLEHLAWRYFHATDLDDDLRERAARLWDSRFAALETGDTETLELVDFEWWIRCGAFNSAWWLPRLIRLAEMHRFSDRLYISDQLETASQVNPAGALHALDLLIRNPGSSHRFLPYGIRKAAPVVVARALDSPDPTSRLRADDLIDFVGRKGLIDFPAEVAKHQQTNETEGRVGTD